MFLSRQTGPGKCSESPSSSQSDSDLVSLHIPPPICFSTRPFIHCDQVLLFILCFQSLKLANVCATVCHVQLCDPRTVARQAPLSMGFSRQEYWNGLSFPPPGHLPNPATEPVSPMFPALQMSSLQTEPPGKPKPANERHSINTCELKAIGTEKPEMLLYPGQKSEHSEKAMGLLWASLEAQLVKNLPVVQETCVQSLGWEDPLEKGKATHSSISGLQNSKDCIVHGITKSHS